MTDLPLIALSAENFRSLRKVEVRLGPLNVLVGPNQAGKSNFLDLVEFLGDAARDDLPEAIAKRGGYERVRFRGINESGAISITVVANVTRYSSPNAPDQYNLNFYARRLRAKQTQRVREVLVRSEELAFKRRQGRGRRLHVTGQRAEFANLTSAGEQIDLQLPLRGDSLALSTLRRLPKDEGGQEIERLASLFTSFRVFNVDVEKARQPARASLDPLAHDASNLASVLINLRESDPDRYADLVDDARSMIPGLHSIEVHPLGGSTEGYSVRLLETGLRNPTSLADASFGAVRILALLALLYDPDPPSLTCIEEIDHGLHPYVFDTLVERLREASENTQFLIATHSPAFVNRLHPSELIVCERNEDGSSRIPAVSAEQIQAIEDATEGRLRLGEIWFSGSLGGVPR